MPHGTTLVRYEAKHRARSRVIYDEHVGLASLLLNSFEGALSLSQSLNASELSDLLDEGAKVLAQMLEAGAIGTDTLNERNARGLERLEHAINPPAKRKRRSVGAALPDVPPGELRRLALLEVEKVREAKRRGDYK